MPPRLAHKKSRKGCVRCKSRKVKCTEERPSCAACLRHSLPCQYPQETNHATAPEETNHSSESSPLKVTSVEGLASPYTLAEDVDALDSDHFQRRLLELRLLHHYVTVVAPNMPASQEEAWNTKPGNMRDLYLIDTVQVAFEYPFLLNTIFAISAQRKMQPQPKHLAELSEASTAATLEAPLDSTYVDTYASNDAADVTSDLAKYARAHRIYLNMAVRQQREALMELGPQNADAVCLTSVLLAFIALKLIPDEPNQKYEPPVQWLSISHAISTVVQASQPFLTPAAVMHRIMLLSGPDFRDRESMFNLAHTEPFQAILDYSKEPFPNNEEDKTYSMAVAYMGGIFRAIQNRDPHRHVARRIMSTAPMLPAQFVTLVDERQPRALVIIAHIMAMSKYVEDYWFFRGTAEHEVYGIQSILPDDWQWAMRWPLEMLKTLAEPQIRNIGA